MGPKITINSATLMNKGLEVIEAYHLFALKPDEIDVLVHPQSIIHGMVEFRDGSLIAQLGQPDMRIPIAHCLAWPETAGRAGAAPRLGAGRQLSFEEPDLARFPALRLAREALEQGAGRAHRAQCRQRGRGRGIPGPPARLHRHRGPGRGDPGGRGAPAALCGSPENMDEAIAIDQNSRSLAKTFCPKLPQRHFRIANDSPGLYALRTRP